MQAIDDLRQTLDGRRRSPTPSLTPLERRGRTTYARSAPASADAWRGCQTRDQEIGDAILTAKTLLSDVEDADLTETITQLAQLQNALEATLTAGTTLMQTTILDFLRL